MMGEPKCETNTKINRQPVFNSIYGLSFLLLCIPGVIMTCVAYGSYVERPEALDIAGPVMLGIGGLLTVGAITVALLKDFINKEPRLANFHERFKKDTHDLAWLLIILGTPLASTGFAKANFNPMGVAGAVMLIVAQVILFLGLLLGKCWKPKEFYDDDYQCTWDNVSEETQNRYRYLYLKSMRDAFNDLAQAMLIPGIPLLCIGYLIAGEGERVFCSTLGVVFLSISVQMLFQSIFQVWCNAYGKPVDYDIYHLKQMVIGDFQGRCVLLAIILTPVGFTQDNGLGIGIAGAVLGGINGIVWLIRAIYTCKVPSPPYPEGRKGWKAEWKTYMSSGVYYMSGVDVETGEQQVNKIDPPPSYDATEKTDTM